MPREAADKNLLLNSIRRERRDGYAWNLLEADWRVDESRGGAKMLVGRNGSKRGRREQST